MSFLFKGMGFQVSNRYNIQKKPKKYLCHIWRATVAKKKTQQPLEFLLLDIHGRGHLQKAG